MSRTRFPICRRDVPSRVPWQEVEKLLSEVPHGGTDMRDRAARGAALGLPPYIFDLARIETAVRSATKRPARILSDGACVNPSLTLLELSWRNLHVRFESVLPDGGILSDPVPGPARILVWKEPSGGVVRVSACRDEDLLALKIVAEGWDPLEAAREGNVSVGRIDGVVDRAVDRGIVLRPPSRIRRTGPAFRGKPFPEEFLSAPVFTLQWHVTQECDLSCRHCYDRTRRSPLTLEEGTSVLRDLRSFCRDRYVRGQVSFTGGNPFLYEHFPALYREAADSGLDVAILGNPVTRRRLEEVLEIRPPVYFQVSLDGNPAENDRIRGKGNFRAVMDFLDLLRKLGVFSVVMLTLTKRNLSQVLPLARRLAGKADRFSFNRLSAAGRGKDLVPADPRDYETFLRAYLEEAAENPVLGRKENLMNLLLHRRGEPPFGGCTGFGCGAAFNFVSLLSDGEVHACRKFPSPIGRLGRQRLAEIYDSPDARKYRNGAKACEGCEVRPVCGGCMAVSWSRGLDVFSESDPYCFRGR